MGDPLHDCLAVCGAILQSLNERPDSEPEVLLAYFAALRSIYRDLERERSRLVEWPELTGSWPQNRASIKNLAVELKAAIEKTLVHQRLNEYEQDFNKLMGRVAYIEVREEDQVAIQEQINSLRDLIMNATWLSENHRARLLQRLERLQVELHKRMSDFDRFYGFALEVMLLAKKAGEAAHPLLDSVLKLADLVYKIQQIAMGLPALPLSIERPQLPSGEVERQDDGATS